MMKQLIISMAIRNGDAEVVKHGKVSMDYIERLENIFEGEEEPNEQHEAKFNQIWKEIGNEVGVDVDKCMLSIDKRDGQVEEIVIINEQLHTNMIESGENVRLKVELP